MFCSLVYGALWVVLYSYTRRASIFLNIIIFCGILYDFHSSVPLVKVNMEKGLCIEKWSTSLVKSIPKLFVSLSLSMIIPLSKRTLNMDSGENGSACLTPFFMDIFFFFMDIYDCNIFSHSCIPVRFPSPCLLSAAITDEISAKSRVS